MKALKTLGYVLGCIWSLPMLPVALLLMAYYKPRAIRWNKGCLEFLASYKRDKTGAILIDEEGRKITRILGNPGGQSVGVPVIAYADETCWNSPRLRRHERIHVIQGFILGIFFGPLYGGHWLIIRVFDTPDEPADMPAWKRAYRAIWAEKQARAHENDPNGWGS
jgi:hypothetical protein